MQDATTNHNARAHGWFSITVDNRVVIIRAFDGWNLEAAKHYSAEMEKTAQAMTGAPWAILSDLTHWALSTPEVGEEIAAMAVKLDALGRTHNAIVARDHGLRQAIVAQAIRTRTQNPVLEFFDDEATALAWLRDCGFESGSDG